MMPFDHAQLPFDHAQRSATVLPTVPWSRLHDRWHSLNKIIHNPLRPNLHLQPSRNGVRLDPWHRVARNLLNLLLLLRRPHRSAEEDSRRRLNRSQQRCYPFDRCKSEVANTRSLWVRISVHSLS